MFGCEETKSKDFDSVIIEIIQYDFSRVDATSVNNIERLMANVFSSEPNFTGLSGTDVNNLCDLLKAYKQLNVSEFNADTESRAVNLESELQSLINNAKYPHITYQRCKGVLSMKSAGEVKRY